MPEAPRSHTQPRKIVSKGRHGQGKIANKQIKSAAKSRAMTNRQVQYRHQGR